MKATIYVYEADGWLASVLEVPGCVARGATRDDAVANARRAFHEYRELLGKYGASTEHWDDLDVEHAQVKDPPARATFPEDFRPMEEHEIRDFLHQMEASRSALLALVRGLSAEDMEKKPTPEMWSVRETLEHIMEGQISYLSRLEKWHDSDVPTLQAVHRLAFQRFSVLEPEDTALDHEVFGRRWSTRKVMRRTLEHEYEHLNHIREILAALGGDRQPS